MADILGATTSFISAGSGLLSKVGSIFGSGSPSIKLPLPNKLSSYASYDYIISISSMTFKDVNFPDTTYKAGKSLPIICASAGKDPNNRVQTAYGKYDFFIDNLKFDTIIGPHSPKATNVTTVQFDIVEPYSLGVFMLALQTAAYNAGFKNWRDAPFLITIEFRGNKEDGSISNIPGCTRHIPIKFTTINFKANEQGSQYMINAYAIQNQALTAQHANLKSDTTVKGKTVQEVLQTGAQSLQAVVNKKLKQMEKDGLVAVADQVLIVFPKDPATTQSPGGAEPMQAPGGATVNPNLSSGSATIFKKVGVTASGIDKAYIQSDADVNELGSASMGYSLDKRGDTTSKDESVVYDEKAGVYTRGSIKSDVKEGSLKFTQDTDIPTVINQVMLMSDHPKVALDTKKEDNGFKTWWRIDTQVYYIDSDENLKKTGTLPRIVVYRILPYLVHSSRVTSVNTPSEGFKSIAKTVVKEYDYIYTGKNSEVLKFDIDFSVSFSNILAADGYKKNADVVRSGETGTKDEKDKTVNPNPTGEKPTAKAGGTTSSVKPTGTITWFDRVGGGGSDDAVTRAARFWHDAINNEKDMVNINMEIYGDPYWVANSGQGNYTSKQVDGIKDLNVDGSVNWQSSEVDVMIIFKSPFDINQTSGLYNFGKTSQRAPVMGFTGLYCINRVTNRFSQGQFRQTLKGFRRPLQESTATPKADSGITSNLPPEQTKK